MEMIAKLVCVLLFACQAPDSVEGNVEACIKSIIQNPCRNNPCQNGGTCEPYSNGTYSCDCLPDYTGSDCDTAIDLCADVQCQNGGTCNENDGTCDCHSAFSGPNCGIGPCDDDSDTCDETGTSSCTNDYTDARGFYCDCYAEYYGDDCENFVPCSLSPCVNDGTCTNVPDSNRGYSCTCEPGYYGNDCELGSSTNGERTKTKVLNVSNGGDYGEWHDPEYCPEGAFAIGYTLKIEGNQGGGDDTALNAVKLYCAFPDKDNSGGGITSGQSEWGTWSGDFDCGERNGLKGFLTSFQMQVESYVGYNFDDTLANYVKFKCRDLSATYSEYSLSSGTGLWGTYGSWSNSCPGNSAICGIRTKIHAPQDSGDDTALNDVKFHCCAY